MKDSAHAENRHWIDERMMRVESRASDSVLDISATLVRLGGDRELLNDIMTFFLEDAPPLVAELKRAAENSDAQAVRSTAHALKGLTAGCGGIRATHAAQRIEHAAQADDLKDIGEQIDDLERELDYMQQAITAYRS